MSEQNTSQAPIVSTGLPQIGESVIVERPTALQMSTADAGLYAAVADSKGVLATATSSNGGRLTGALTDQSRVTVRGVEMAVAQAVALGALAKTGEGQYAEVDFEAAEKARAEAEAKERADAAEAAEGLEVEVGAGQMLTRMSQSVEAIGHNAVATMTAFLNDPTRIPPAMLDVIRARGYSETDVLGEMRQVGAEVERAIGAHVRKRGVESPEAFFEYVKRTQPDALARAAASALYEGNMTPFNELAATYLRGTVARAPSGLETFVKTDTLSGSQIEYVKLPNGLVTTVQNARNLGLL